MATYFLCHTNVLPGFLLPVSYQRLPGYLLPILHQSLPGHLLPVSNQCLPGYLLPVPHQRLPGYLLPILHQSLPGHLLPLSHQCLRGYLLPVSHQCLLATFFLYHIIAVSCLATFYLCHTSKYHAKCLFCGLCLFEYYYLQIWSYLAILSLVTDDHGYLATYLSVSPRADLEIINS